MQKNLPCVYGTSILSLYPVSVAPNQPHLRMFQTLTETKGQSEHNDTKRVDCTRK